MDYKVLKSNVADIVKTNGNQEITGQLMQDVLFALIENLGEGWQFGGAVKSSDAPSLGDDVRAFYIAVEKGVYGAFGGVSVTELSVITHDSGYAVVGLGISFDDAADIKELAEKVAKNIEDIAANAKNIAADEKRISALEANGSVTTARLADGAVTSAKIDSGAHNPIVFTELTASIDEADYEKVLNGAEVGFQMSTGGNYIPLTLRDEDEDYLSLYFGATLAAPSGKVVNFVNFGVIISKADRKVEIQIPSGMSSFDLAQVDTNKADIAALGTKVTAEETARKDADADLQTKIDAVNASVVDEISARESADSTLDAKISSNSTAIASNKSDIARINETLGPYTDRADVVLTPTETGYAISSDGVKVAKSGWAIAEFNAERGVEYLFKPGTIDGGVCIFAQKVTSKETRAIDYTYTYDDEGRVATAKATYNGKTHTYTYTYDEETGTATITDESGTVVTSLPYQYETSVGTYLPMTRLNAGAELPKDGYCRLMSHFQGNASLSVVVSYKVGSADLTMRAVKDGVFASVATQLGNLSQNIASTQAALAGVEKTAAGNEASIEGIVAETRDFDSIPTLCGQPMILFGAGTPQESIVPSNWNQYDPDTDTGYDWTGVPSALGQVYINTSASSNGRYTAVWADEGAQELKWLNF